MILELSTGVADATHEIVFANDVDRSGIYSIRKDHVDANDNDDDYHGDGLLIEVLGYEVARELVA